jgi:hypothetical protein
MAARRCGTLAMVSVLLAAALPARAAAPPAVVLCLDASRAMAALDPGGARAQAAAALARLVPPGTRLGVVDFGDRVAVASARRALPAAPLGATPTALAAALRAAQAALGPPGPGPRVVLVVVDAAVPPAAAAAARAAARALAGAGARLEVLAVGPDGVPPALQALAAAGGGAAEPVWDADDVVLAVEAVAAGALAPVPAPAPAPVRLRAIAARREGDRAVLLVEATNPGPGAAWLTARGPGAARPERVRVPPGTHRLALELPAPAGTRSLVVRWAGTPSPEPVALRFRLPAPSPPTPWWLFGLLAGAAGAFGGAARRRRRPPRDVLVVEGPLGRVEVPLPAGRRLVVGPAGCREADVRLPGVAGAEPFFVLWRGEDGTAQAEALWPFHLYRGELPERSFALTRDRPFAVGGVRLVYRAAGAHRPGAGDRPGRDVLGEEG